MERMIDTSLPGVGEILGAYANDRSDIMAIASEFRLLTEPPARASYGGTAPRRRVGLYNRGTRRPFAHLDSLRYPVNDIAFHPVYPVLAIATGSYDGGWMFEGELVLWNWETGEVGAPLIKTPEIVRTAFTEDGSAILAFSRPWDEGMAEGDEAFDMYFELRATFFEDLSQGVSATDKVTAQMERQTPKTTRDVFSDQRFADPKDPVAEISRFTGVTSLAQRSPIWDIAWLGDDKLGVVHDDCHLQTIGLRDEALSIFKGTGHGSEILFGTSTYVHVVERNDDAEWPNANSSSLLEFQDGRLVSRASFIGSHTFAISASGELLGRRDRSGIEEREAPFDQYFDGQSWHSKALGHYDVFNHFIRIDGAPYLFFVQNDQPFANPLDFFGSEENSFSFKHPEKWVCMVNEQGDSKRLWPILQDDGTDASHPMECDFAYLSDELGEALVVGGKHYNPNPYEAYKGFVYRRDLWTGKELWRHSINASPSQIIYSGETGVVLVFTLNGEYLVINAKTGALLVLRMLRDTGLPTVAFSAALKRSSLALGMIDGGIVATDLENLVT